MLIPLTEASILAGGVFERDAASMHLISIEMSKSYVCELHAGVPGVYMLSQDHPKF